MKQNMFFSHSAVSIGLSVYGGALGLIWCDRVLSFFLPSTIAYPFPPTHP